MAFICFVLSTPSEPSLVHPSYSSHRWSVCGNRWWRWGATWCLQKPLCRQTCMARIVSCCMGVQSECMRQPTVEAGCNLVFTALAIGITACKHTHLLVALCVQVECLRQLLVEAGCNLVFTALFIGIKAHKRLHLLVPFLYRLSVCGSHWWRLGATWCSLRLRLLGSQWWLTCCYCSC